MTKTTTKARKKISDIAGKVCEAVLPIKHGYYLGTGRNLAICTLSSMGLLEEISKSKDIMKKVAIAGRLLSENKGIDAIIRFTLTHPELNHIIVCGQEVSGHKAGQALLSLHRNGIDSSGRIIGAVGPCPILESASHGVEAFRKQVRITDMIGIVELTKVMPALVS